MGSLFLRTSKTATLTWEGEEFRFDDVADHVSPGEVYDVPGAMFTQRKYGPVLVATWWRKDCKEPIHLVTNMTSAEEACGYYRKRFKIETLFSVQKSRGFHLQKSHLSDPARLSRLMIAAGLAYILLKRKRSISRRDDPKFPSFPAPVRAYPNSGR